MWERERGREGGREGGEHEGRGDEGSVCNRGDQCVYVCMRGRGHGWREDEGRGKMKGEVRCGREGGRGT